MNPLSTIAAAAKTAPMFAGPFLSRLLRGRVTPVLAGYKITHKCNLKCVHCPYWRRSGQETDFEQVVSTMRRLRDMGVRILILEGGEPLLWRDEKRTIKDVVSAAREMFGSVCMTTNGTLPWDNLPLDRVWVSLDGPRVVHDSIRGQGVFDRVWRNIRERGKGRAFISATINRLNMESVPELIVSLQGVAEGVTIQFHYPYQGLPDPLFVKPEERAPLLEELIKLKAQGFPVANSVTSLREMKREGWSCEDGLLANAEPDGSVTEGCYLKNRGDAQCSLCGFSAHNEMTLAFNGHVEAILTGVRIFFSKKGLGTLP